jgi:zinc protease
MSRTGRCAARAGVMVALALAILSLTGAPARAAKAVRLDNGLEVIAEEARISPLVAVSVLYRVGSRNEVTGKTGVSHFVEHMLFNGTEKYPEDAAVKEILRNGGVPNGETYWDYTHFGGVVPSDKIDRLLDIEADRMANAKVDSQAVEDERDIILEELAMRGEAPMLVLLEDLFATSFKIHPYHHWYPGGYFTDVDRMDAAYVRDFYEMYYHPANTIISVVGNIDEDEAIEKVRRHFESITGGPQPVQTFAEEPDQMGLRRVTVRGDAAEGRIMVFFKGPEYASRDYEIGSVMTFLLANGRSTVFSKKLVETGIATDVAFILIPTIDPFGFLLVASVEEGGDIRACEKAIHDAIEEFKQTPPEEDLVKRAITRLEGLTILGQQTPRARAFQLAQEAARGDWAYADAYLENIRSITADDVQHVAGRYLNWEKATIGWLIPKSAELESSDLIGMNTGRRAAGGVLPETAVSVGAGIPAESGVSLGAGMIGDAGQIGAAGILGVGMHPGGGCAAGEGTASQGMAMTFGDAIYEELPNGVTLVLKEDHTLPVVAIRAYVVAGAAYEPDMKYGLARLTAKTVAMGSADYPYDHLYERIEALGSNISVESDLDRAFIGTSVLSAHWEEAARMICDLLVAPGLKAKDFERARRELLSEISQIEEDAKNLGLIKFREHYYAGHPYARPKAGRRETVRGLSVRDVRNFHRDVWTPEGTVITAVGDFDAAGMRGLLAEYLAGWDRQRRVSLDLPELVLPAGFTRQIETLPEKRQVKIFWGMKGPSMNTSDFAAWQVMNFIFGGQVFGSRLFDRIREKESLAYVVQSDMEPTKRPSAVYIHLGTRPNNVQKAIDATAEEIDRMIATEVTDEEMDLVKNFLKSLLPFMMQTYAQIGSQLQDLVFFDLPRDYYDTMPERIDGVTRDDVRAAASKYLDPDNSIIVIVGAVDENLKPVRPTAGSKYDR